MVGAADRKIFKDKARSVVATGFIYRLFKCFSHVFEQFYFKHHEYCCT